MIRKNKLESFPQSPNKILNLSLQRFQESLDLNKPACVQSCRLRMSTATSSFFLVQAVAQILVFAIVSGTCAQLNLPVIFTEVDFHFSPLSLYIVEYWNFTEVDFHFSSVSLYIAEYWNFPLR